MKPCPISPCRRQLASRQVMCPDHWERVPEDFRKPIQDLKRSADTEAYRLACQEAVAHVQGEETLRREIDDYVASVT